MIDYDPKQWFRITFSVRGTVIRRVCVRLIEMGSITAALCLLDSWLRQRFEHGLPALDPVGHTVMGVAVGMLIVFRNNSSYDRYWEGRKLWGAIVNTSRNLVRGAAAYVGAVPDLARLVAAYAFAVKQQLRGAADLREVQALLPVEIFATIAGQANPPSALAYYLSSWIETQHAAGRLNAQQAQTLEKYVAVLVDCQGGCERIQKTPIPFAYAVHIKQFVLLYVVTLPFVVISRVGWLSIPLVMVVTFGLYGVEEAGVEIEDPFGTDPNDLPTDDICGVIQRDTQVLAQLPGPAPTAPVVSRGQEPI